MKPRWAALSAVLVLSALVPRSGMAQARVDSSLAARKPASSVLGQSSPRSFQSEARIPFVVGDPPNCTDQGKKYRVTMKIFNLLAQLVAVPVLKGGDDKEKGERLDNLDLSCRPYTAYWDGSDLTNKRKVGSGVYLYKLEVDGKTVVKKIVVK
jgi:hypothetical protein